MGDIIFAITVFAFSAATVSLEQEGCLSSLTPRGYEKPILTKSGRSFVAVAPNKKEWRNYTLLSADERHTFGLHANQLFDAKGQPDLSSDVEKAI